MLVMLPVAVPQTLWKKSDFMTGKGLHAEELTALRERIEFRRAALRAET